MTYEELIPVLQANHFYPAKITEIKRKKDICTGLWLYCAPILADDKLTRIMEVLPEGFKADYISSRNEIHIVKTIKPINN